MADRISKTYDFKSVGERDAIAVKRVRDEVVKLPIGIKTPLELGTGEDGIFKMHRDLDETIADDFRNLLLTNRGDRLFHHNIGANLREICFELGTDDGDVEAIARIRSATRAVLPFIELLTFETFVEPSIAGEIAKVGIRISYSIPVVSNKQRQIEVILHQVN